MKITIYGCGYVGLVSAACFASLQHEVLAVDISAEKIEALKQGQSPIFEPGLSELLSSKNLQFTTDLEFAANFSSIQMVCVGTPEKEDGSADLSSVYACVQAITKHAREKKIMVIKSTVPVGTGDACAQSNKSHTFISNPEFLREGLAIHDFMNPERVVIGGDDVETMEIVANLYQVITNAEKPIVKMDRCSAELSKYAANAMLATRISFINEIARVAEKVGADIDQVAYSMGLDSRIGPQFLKAGCGYGGSCFPKDVAALRVLAKQAGVEMKLLSAVDTVNAEQKLELVKKITQRFGEDLSKFTFAIWGLAFKPDTDDIREASSLVLIRELLAKKATLQVYDPAAMGAVKREFSNCDNLYFVSDQYEALNQADALVIVTEWAVFKNADKKQIKTPVIFDGRNIFTKQDWPEAEYYSIGRGNINPKNKREDTQI